MAFAGIHTIKHPIKAASEAAKASKTGYKVVKGLGKFSLEHPYLAPFTAALLAGAYGGLKLSEKTPNGLLGGAYANPGNAQLRALSQLLGGQPRAIPGLGHTHLGGTPAASTAAGEHLRELIAIRNAIIELHNHGESGQQIIGEMHMDSTKVGEVIALNPKAMRFLAEAVERASLTRNARR